MCQVILSAWHAATCEIRQGTGMLIPAFFPRVKPDIYRISLDRFRVLAVICNGTFDARHCTETLSEFDHSMDFVPLGCVKCKARLLQGQGCLQCCPKRDLLAVRKARLLQGPSCLQCCPYSTRKGKEKVNPAFCASC